jgi:AcrR family transcriptional regulator
MPPQEVNLTRRNELLSGAVEYVLEHGLTDLSLRPLAAALDTSDRMVLYYFGTRDALVTAVLGNVADRLRALLAAALPPEPQRPAAILASALGVADDRAAARLLGLWLEVVARAGTADTVFAETAAAVIEDWVSWFAERIDVPTEQRRAAAAGVLVVIDGLVLFETAGAHEDARAGAGWLIAALG